MPKLKFKEAGDTVIKKKDFPVYPTECQQLVAMLREALIKEHDAVNTYERLNDFTFDLMNKYHDNPGNKSSDVNSVLLEITEEEMIHEQELNILIQRVSLMCPEIETNFDAEEILKKAKHDTKIV